MINSELTLACAVSGKHCKENLLTKEFFYPFAPSYRGQSLAITRRKWKTRKKKYNQRILDGENGSFTSLVFTSISGKGTETKQFHRGLIQLLCEKSCVS